MDVTKITSSVLINNNVDTFEINDWKSILILLITSSFAGFLGGLFGTAGRFTSFSHNMYCICIYLHPCQNVYISLAYVYILFIHFLLSNSLQYIYLRIYKGPPFMVWLTYNRDVDKNIWRACASHMTSVCISREF